MGAETPPRWQQSDAFNSREGRLDIRDCRKIDTDKPVDYYVLGKWVHLVYIYIYTCIHSYYIQNTLHCKKQRCVY